MEVVFTQSAGGSEIGPFKIGDERDIPDRLARVWIKRGVCKAKRQTTDVRKKKEVKGHGNE